MRIRDNIFSVGFIALVMLLVGSISCEHNGGKRGIQVRMSPVDAGRSA